MKKLLPTYLIALTTLLFPSCDITEVETTEAVLYVTDENYDFIAIVDYEGQILDTDDDLNDPQGLDFLPGVNHFWVADSENDRVVRYNFDLEQEAVSTNGILNNPADVAVLPDGGCWVADHENYAFVRVDSSGNEIARLTGTDYTLIVEYDPTQDEVWCTEGSYLHAADANFTGEAEIEDTARLTVNIYHTIRGLAVNSRRNHVWVADSHDGIVYCLNGETGEVIFENGGWPNVHELSLNSNGDCWAAVKGVGRVIRLSGTDGELLDLYENLSDPDEIAAGVLSNDAWVGMTAILIRLDNGEIKEGVQGFAQPSGIEIYDPNHW